MEYDYVYCGLLLSASINVCLLFVLRAMQRREKHVLEATQEMLAISEQFSAELQMLKNETEEV